MIARPRVEKFLESIKVGLLELGPCPVGEAVTEAEDSKNPVGLGLGVLQVPKTKTVVGVLVIILAAYRFPTVGGIRDMC